MRVFVALDIPAEVRSRLAEFMGRLKETCRGARWVRAEGMHVTLKFIGEVPAEKEARIREELAAAARARDFGVVDLNFRNVGFFPNPRHPRVFWAGIEAGENLAALAGEVEARLEPIGIAREKRDFKPHLTLARFKSEAGLPHLCAALEKIGPAEFGRAQAEEFHLYQSTLRPAGAEYTKQASFRFTARR